MKVILHFPRSQKMRDELANRVATIHAQAILASVNQLECPIDQKIALIEAVRQRVYEDIKMEEYNPQST